MNVVLEPKLEYRVSARRMDGRLKFLHTNIRKYGTISNTLASALTLEGMIKRMTLPGNQMR